MSFSKKLIFLILLSFFCLFIFSEARAEQVTLSQKETKDLLLSYHSQIGSGLAQLAITDPSWQDKEQTALSLIAALSQKEMADFYFVDLPQEIFVGLFKYGLKTARFYFFPTSLLAEIERFSVSKAVSYLISFFEQNQIKIGQGILSKTLLDGRKIEVWYMIVLKEEKDNQFKININFYSPSFVPSVKEILALNIGDNIKNFLPLYEDKGLDPFVMTVSGQLKKGIFTKNFEIYETKVDFNSIVPDIPQSAKEEKFSEKIQPALEDLAYFCLDLAEAGKIFGSQAKEVAKIIKQALALNERIERFEKLLTKLKAFLGNSFSLRKELAPSQKKEAQKTIEELKEEVRQTKKEIESLEAQPTILEESKQETVKRLKGKIEEYEKEIKKMEKTLEISKTLPKIIISEVCVGWDKAENEFIELYNPNDFDVFLDSQNFSFKLVSSSDNQTKKQINFKRGKIPANGYFLLVGGRIFSPADQEITPDATFSSQLSGSGGVIIEDGFGNVIDKVAWGSEKKPPPLSSTETKGVILESGLQTGQSIQRKNQKDSDNNWIDFELSFWPSPTNSLGERLIYSFSQLKPQRSAGSNIGGGSSSPSFYNWPKILINEIQIASEKSQKDEFVELYNPNSFSLNLDGWYLQRKTKSGNLYSFATKDNFSGKKIDQKGYFLIARKDSLFESIADLVLDNSLAEDSTLILKNPDGEISDKVGWGNASDFETNPAPNPPLNFSIGRKMDQDTVQDTDNNFFDFEIQKPTPKTKNEKTKKETKISDFFVAPGSKKGEIELSFSFPDQLEGFEYELKYSTSSSLFEEWQDFPLFKSEIISKGNIYKYFVQDLLADSLYYFGLKAKDKEGNFCASSDLFSSWPSGLSDHLLINEILLDGQEFLEIYNPTNEEIDLSLYYLSYFSFKEQNPRDWNEPFKTQKFPPDAKIGPGGYYLIGFGDFEGADWNIKNIQLNNEKGAIGIFSSDPSLLDPFQAKNAKVDLIAWGISMNQTNTKEKEAVKKLPPKNQSLERKVLGWDADNNDFDFQIQENPTPTFPVLVIKLEDKTNYYNCLVGHSGASWYQIDLEWSASNPSRVEYYQVQYKINNSDWQDYYSQTLETKIDNFEVLYTLFDDRVYSFRVRAKEKGKNFTEWQEITLDFSHPVVINEIAIRGTTADGFDQWIELYNKSPNPVDISGWKLLATAKFLELQGTIPPYGYFLLEKKDDDVISDIVADQIFKERWDFSYVLTLTDSKGREIDRYYLGSYYYKKKDECFKQGNSYSLERISPLVFGSDPENWQCNDGKIINAKDRAQNPIFGTPKSQNSVYQIYTSFASNFVENFVLGKNLNPYLFHSTPSLLAGINLTIEPGIKIMFKDNDSGFDINGGILKAIGTSNEKILFTSFNSSPFAGSWRRIYIKDGAQLELNNVIIEYGGDWGPLYDGGVIESLGSTLFISEAIIKDNKTSGIQLYDSDAVIENSQFLNHSNSKKNASALYIEGGNVKISNSYFENNYYGIYIAKGNPVLENLTFKDNICDIYWQNSCLTFEEYQEKQKHESQP